MGLAREAGAAALPAGAKLIEGDTTAYSDTYALPNGHLLTHYSPYTINARDAAGGWQALSGSLPASSGGAEGGAAQPALTGSPLGSAGALAEEEEERGVPQEDELSCTIISSTPATSACNRESSFQAGYDATGESRRRSLLSFTLQDEHENEEVTTARLELYVKATTTTSAASMGVYRASKPWTDAATWDTSNGSTAWEKAGGDFAEGGANEAVNASVGTKTGWAYWYPTRLVQEWYNGSYAPTGDSQPDYGFLIKDVEEGKTNNVLTFEGRNEAGHYPGLWVETVRRGVGESSRYTQLTTPLSGSQSLSVNPASGNLLIHSNDFSIPDAGFEFDSARTWNSLRAGEPSGYGEGWVDSNAVYIEPPKKGGTAVTFTDGSNHTFVFTREGAGFITPPGIDATLCIAGSPSPCPASLPSGTTYQLIYDETGEHIDFAANYEGNYPINAVNKSGQTLTAGYRRRIAEEPLSWTDAEGTKIAYAYGAGGYTKITNEATGQSAAYSEEAEYGAYKLLKYTSMSGEVTSYGYGEALESTKVAKITEPSGEVVKLSYDERGVIAKVERIAAGEPKTTTVTTYTYYEFGKAPAPCTAKQKGTLVTGPEMEGENAQQTLYCSNVFDEVEGGTSLTTATGQPGWYALIEEAPRRFEWVASDSAGRLPGSESAIIGARHVRSRPVSA
ncbi:MAG: DNRLRE domain-containing protein, partial [Solirubrobacteraceae bacterium]